MIPKILSIVDKLSNKSLTIQITLVTKFIINLLKNINNNNNQKNIYILQFNNIMKMQVRCLLLQSMELLTCKKKLCIILIKYDLFDSFNNFSVTIINYNSLRYPLQEDYHQIFTQ
ncbi:unnamed protein product [Paramecium sonneborni]|uniref:Uncharacterized protein n=1 Tax=Paramecium sonneborni TaxID=65129 RepID=A0A8S1QMW6_9CILI|nr:unnamed protein product [Paramecium sonneborni]